MTDTFPELGRISSSTRMLGGKPARDVQGIAEQVADFPSPQSAEGLRQGERTTMTARRSEPSPTGVGYSATSSDPSRESALKAPFEESADSSAVEVMDRAVRRVLRDLGEEELAAGDRDVLQREIGAVA